jgi:hypothetical protein
MSRAGIGFFFLQDTVMNCCLLLSAAAVMHAAQLSLFVGGLCSCGAAGMGAQALDLPLLGFLPVGPLGAGVVEYCWHAWWSSAVIEATCFSSSCIWFVLVACEESSTFSICSTCRKSCRMSCLLESVRAIPTTGVLVAVSAGGILEHFHKPVKGGILRLEGPGTGVDHWEVGGGEPTERDKLFTLKVSRVC